MSRVRQIASWLMILAVIVLAVYAIFWINSESFACVSNPYTYSIALLEKANSAPVSCVCTPQKPNAISATLTKDGFSLDKSCTTDSASCDVGGWDISSLP